MGGELVPAIVEPGFGIQGVVVAGAHGVIPLPRGQFAVLRLSIHQRLRHTMSVAFRLLEHGELIGVYRLILMDAGLDVPAGEVSAIAARKCACPETADRNTLPVAVVDV